MDADWLRGEWTILSYMERSRIEIEIARQLLFGVNFLGMTVGSRSRNNYCECSCGAWLLGNTHLFSMWYDCVWIFFYYPIVRRLASNAGQGAAHGLSDRWSFAWQCFTSLACESGFGQSQILTSRHVLTLGLQFFVLATHLTHRLPRRTSTTRPGWDFLCLSRSRKSAQVETRTAPPLIIDTPLTLHRKAVWYQWLACTAKSKGKGCEF